MDFNLTESCPAQISQPVEIFFLVFLDGKEERVPRRPSVAIVKPPELAWVPLGPGCHALSSRGEIHTSRSGLVMVRDTQDHMHFFITPGFAIALPLPYVSWQPAL